MLKELLRSLGLSEGSLPLGYNEADFSREYGFEWALQMLGLKESQLQGKRILNVGAGNDFFGQTASEKGLEVISLDCDYGSHPDLTEKWDFFKRKYCIPKNVQAIGAVAEKLPFRSGTFDYVISVHSIPKYSTSVCNAGLAIEEMVRVVKPGGEIRIYPFLINPALALEIRKGGESFPPSRKKIQGTSEEELKNYLNKDEKMALIKLRRKELEIYLIKPDPEEAGLSLVIQKRGGYVVIGNTKQK